jgi:hypothetical protein
MNIYVGRWRLVNDTEVYLSRYNVLLFIATEISNNYVYDNDISRLNGVYYNEQGQCIQNGTLVRVITNDINFASWDVKELVEAKETKEAKVEDKVDKVKRVINNAILCLSCTE